MQLCLHWECQDGGRCSWHADLARRRFTSAALLLSLQCTHRAISGQHTPESSSGMCDRLSTLRRSCDSTRDEGRQASSAHLAM